MNKPEFLGTVDDNVLIEASPRLTVGNPVTAYPRGLKGRLVCVLDVFLQKECYHCKDLAEMLWCDAAYGRGGARSMAWYDVPNNDVVITSV